MTSVVLQLSREDALAAARLHHLAYVCGRFCAVAIGTLTALYVAAILFLLGATRDGLTVAAAGALAVPALLYGVLLVRHAILPRIIVHQQFRQHRAAHEVYEIAWSECSYSVRGTTVQSEVPWGDYWRWRENGRVMLLYPSSRQYQLVPKRLLAPGATEAIRASLRKAGVRRAPILLS